ncbi:MAG TPA: hypothetical protein VGP07_05910 [Polyangia bacterium]
MTARPLLLFPLLAATLALGCLGSEPPAIALYPNAATVRLPPDQVATLIGPIARVDDHDVTDLGGPFELLPGCHVVELTRRIPNNGYALSTGTYFTGQLPVAIFALPMKPGARYVLRRDLIPAGTGMQVRLAFSAREELPGGAATDLHPSFAWHDVVDCRATHAATAR